jgi:uncharacterized lipoprotein
MRIPTLLMACCLGALLLPGCKSHGTTCKQDNKDYVGAKELPPLKAPPGLEPPDTRNALKVPPLDTPERPRAKNEACLDVPPPFANPKGPDAAKPK